MNNKLKMITNDDIKILKEVNYDTPPKVEKVDKKEGKTVSSLRKIKNNIPFKSLNFNPLAFISDKYAQKTLLMINKNRMNIGEINEKNKRNKKSNKIKDNREYIYPMNTSKIKLKPLNKTKSCSHLNSKFDDILIPSFKTTQDIINYNISSKHNTLLNYYHKNNRNVKIIKFTKYFRDFNDYNNHNYNTVNKSDILYKNSNSVSRNDISTFFNKNDSINALPSKYSKINNDNKKVLNQTKMTISKANSQQNIDNKKSKLDYEAEILGKKLPHNLRFFHDNFFKNKQKVEDIKRGSKLYYNKNEKQNELSDDFLANRSNSEIKYQVIEFGGRNSLMATKLTNKYNKKSSFCIDNSNKDDFHHIMKNPFSSNDNHSDEFNKYGNNLKYNPLEYGELANKIHQLLLNPNIKKKQNDKILISSKLNNDKKEMNYKELKELSKKGYEKMQADKFRKFNNLVKDCNKEVIDLGEKIDELLEENKNKFLKAEEGLF